MTRLFRRAFAAALLCLASFDAVAEGPKHAISMYGDPVLPPDFVSLPQANPDAPQGGTLVLGELGGFDSMNPYIRKGRAPWGVQAHTVETLMGRNYDEPFALYGLLAESIEVPEDRSWVAFTLRPEARFSTGDPVTVEDVIWSFVTLGTSDNPRYAGSWANVETIEATSDRSLRITFKEPDMEAPLIMGLRPVLRKADWDGRDFSESSLELVTGSGPYVVSDFEPGRFLTLKRNPDYWGNDLPFNQGQHNFSEIRYEYFRDAGALFEAFKRGELSFFRELNAARWDNAYDFPARRDGRVVRSEVPHNRPSGISGFVMNTRSPLFDDWRVREAMIQLFNFDFINSTITGGADQQITSYFSNSVFAKSDGPATGLVAELLAPFSAVLLPGVTEGYTLPTGTVSGRDRGALRRALALFEEAGWTVQNGVLSDRAGTPFAFDVLLEADETEHIAIMNLYSDALKQAGIDVTITAVDDVQYRERVQNYGFDMTYYRRSLSLSPGNEQRLYWGSAAAEQPGTRNFMGARSPAIDAMIDAMLTAETTEEFTAAVKALDRILTAGRYVIPFWHTPYSRLAHSRDIAFPDYIPMYGDWLGFMPETWYSKTVN